MVDIVPGIWHHGVTGCISLNCCLGIIYDGILAILLFVLYCLVTCVGFAGEGYRVHFIV